MRCRDAPRPRPLRRAFVVALGGLLALLLAMAPALAQRPGAPEDESAAFVAEARKAMRSGRPRDAARSLDQAMQLNPRRIEAYVLRGAVYQSMAQYREGIALMRRAQFLVPDNLEVQARLGALLLAAGEAQPRSAEWLEGLPLLESVVRRDRGRHEAFLALGQAWRRRGEHRRAIAALRTYLRVRPVELAGQDADLTVDLADSYLRARLPRVAAAKLTELLDPTARASASGSKGGPAERRRQQRAELARASAVAAVDCVAAEPLLRAIASWPREVSLLRGRCALELGKLGEAAEQAKRYLADKAADRAVGVGLLGDVAAEQGDLLEAKELYERGLQLVPGDRALTVRRASLYRRAGQAASGLIQLRLLGEPARAEDDPLWWREMARALLASGELAALKVFRGRLAPLLIEQLSDPSDEELFTPLSNRLADAALWALLGEIDLKLGQTDAAVSALLVAQRLRRTAATQELLDRATAQASVERAAARLVAGDAAAAELLLASLAQVRGRATSAPSGPAMAAIDAALWRNLGVARLALGRGELAVEALTRAREVAPGAINAMLLARATALVGDAPLARRLYEEAARLATGDERLEVAIDRASFELARSEPLAAVEILRAAAELPASPRAASAGRGAGKTAVSIAPAALAERHRVALSTARHAAGLAALRAGQSSRALELLQEGGRAEAPLALRCDHALAKIAAQSGDAGRELQKLGKLQCPFAVQGDAQVLKLLAAVADSETPSRARAALARLQSLAPRGSSGTSAAAAASSRSLWSAAVRVAALNAASHAYQQWQDRRGARAGNLAAARQYLRRARQAPAGFGDDELALAEAVLDIAESRFAAAEAKLEALAPRLPEAELHLGLSLSQRAGAEAPAARAELEARALAAWRRARRGGVRWPQLIDWIRAKERLEAKTDAKEEPRGGDW